MGVKLHNSFQIILKAIFIDTILFIIDLLDLVLELFIKRKQTEKREKRNAILVGFFFIIIQR